MSQNTAILAHLQSGMTLTPAEAYQRFSTLALHSRIAELREQGHPVVCVMLDTAGGKRVGCYSLPESHIRRPPIDTQIDLGLSAKV